MKSRTIVSIMAGGLVLVAGCGFALDLLSPSTVSIVMINESPDFVVDVDLAWSDDEDAPELLILTLGDDRSFTLSPGEQTPPLVKDCDDLQALLIEDATLRAVLLQPDTDTGVLRMGEDFFCGDRLVFTFTHSNILVDFDVHMDRTAPF